METKPTPPLPEGKDKYEEEILKEASNRFGDFDDARFAEFSNGAEWFRDTIHNVEIAKLQEEIRILKEKLNQQNNG